MEGGNTEVATDGLVPSQAMKSRRNNNRRRRKPKPKKQNADTNSVENVESNDVNADANSNAHKNTKPAEKSKAKKKPKQPKKQNADTNSVENVESNDVNADANSNAHKNTKPAENLKAKKRPKPNRKKKNKNKFPWRKDVPPNTVDPISLDPLVSMPYPPFALNISPPYDIVPEWPIPKPTQEEANGTKEVGDANREVGNSLEADTKKRQNDLLQEQWGDLLPGTKTENKKERKQENSEEEDENIVDDIDTKQKQHFHLFDGKVLAVYLVSTLQFIDPLNRRDLTREEVKNLDSYLAKHRLKKMRVLEAYDEKGVSMSSAGANAQTQSGRLRMRQEEARNLLNSLFQDHAGVQQQPQQQINRSRRNNNGSRGDGRSAEGNTNNAMSSQYAAYESGRLTQQSTHDQSQYNYGYDSWNGYGNGVYAENNGMLIIDDDFNPGLRGGLPDANFNSSMATNAGEMPNWYGHRARESADNFPSLPIAGSSVSETNPNSSNGQQDQPKDNKQPTKPKTVSKSLSKIGKFGKKSNPKQLEKQRKARELALKKAEIASMPYEEAVKRAAEDINTVSVNHVSYEDVNIPIISNHVAPTEMQLDRNRNLAAALDVKPSTLRGNMNSGWTRPTQTPVTLDEFGNELNLTQYSDALIIEARERMTELSRLEKKWSSFLKDDKAASCPLKPMDRPLRKFVHAYSDFWNLHTESFDPQPKRYIHCVKLLETRAPRPLLSAAVHSWRGPAPPLLPAAEKPSAMTEQHAGEETNSSREFVQTEERAPLKLEPRTVSDRIVAPPGAMFDLVDEDVVTASNISVAPFASQEPAARFAPILAERERPTLKLDARTKPLELPKYQPARTLNTAEMLENHQMRMNASSERKRIEEKRKKSIIAAAFGSDDEETDSDWEVEEAVFSGSDDE